MWEKDAEQTYFLFFMCEKIRRNKNIYISRVAFIKTMKGKTKGKKAKN